MIFPKAPRPKGPDDKKPALMGIILLLGLVLAALAQAVMGSSLAEAPQAVSAVPDSQVTSGMPPAAPVGLQAVIENLASREQGKNGVLVRSVEDDWVAGYKGATTFSQGSVRRLWLGAALLDVVDRGELTLEQQVPLLALRKSGRQRKERVDELLRRAVHADDREAQDHVLDGLMGPAGMARWLADKEIDEVAYGPSNRDMKKLSARARESFLTNPQDGATPDGMAFGLAQLFAGKLLSGNSAQLLLGYFTALPASPGHDVEPGWRILRMTGETTVGDAQVIAASGVALVRSRTGRRFIVVVFADGAADARGRRSRLLNGAVSAIEHSETP